MSDNFELPLLHGAYLSELTEEGIVETINNDIKLKEKALKRNLSDAEKAEIAAQVRKQKHEQMLHLIAYYSKRDRQLCVVRETAMRHKQANSAGYPYPTDLATHIVETVSEW